MIAVSAEGAVTYKALLFIPGATPYDYYTKEYEKGQRGAPAPHCSDSRCNAHPAQKAICIPKGSHKIEQNQLGELLCLYI